MTPTARSFIVTLAASNAAAAASALALVLLARAGGGRGDGALVLRWLAAVPPAAAASLAGILSPSARAVALNSFAFALPQAGLWYLWFFVARHPGGPGGAALVLGTAPFWVGLAALHLLSAAFVGAAALLARALLRPRPGAPGPRP